MDGSETGSVILASPAPELNRLWRDALQDIGRLDSAVDLDSLLKKLERHCNVTVLLDLSLPGLDNLQGIQEIHTAFPHSKIVAVSDSANEKEIAALFHVGVKGVCHRNMKPAMLRMVVRKIDEGEVWLKRRLVDAVLSEIVSHCPDEGEADPVNAHPALSVLSVREKEIATLVGEGLCQKSIASRLAISEHTVKNHLRNIFRKIGVTSRLQLALLVKGKLRAVGKT